MTLALPGRGTAPPARRVGTFIPHVDREPTLDGILGARLDARRGIAMTCRLLLLTLFVLPVLPAARAADQSVRGSSLVVKDPGSADQRKITAKAREVGSDDTLVGDPVTGGATVTITANGV